MDERGIAESAMAESAMAESAMAELLPDCHRRGETRSLLKVVLCGILISLTLKVSPLIALDHFNTALPIIDPFFPAFFSSQIVARVAYVLACSGCLIAIFAKQQKHLLATACLILVSVVVLTIHQSAYNDVTFMCCSWTALWCVWMSSRLHEPFESLFPRAVWLAHVILSLIFLGGAVGKFTDGYWSGQVLYDIYFEKRDFWFYNIMRNSLSAESLRSAATVHSRMVICGELVCGFLWLLPAKVASVVAIVMLCGIALTNNFLLFSVVACLIGLAIIGLHTPREGSDG